LKEQGQEFGTCLFDSRNIIKREEGRGLSGYRSVDDKTAPEGTQLVEKDNTERSSSDVFRELSALIVSHISRRRADLEKIQQVRGKPTGCVSKKGRVFIGLTSRDTEWLCEYSLPSMRTIDVA
jgi:hypothetical protein